MTSLPILKLFDAAGEKRVPRVHRTERNEGGGCPTRRFYAWGFSTAMQAIRVGWRKCRINQVKSPRRKPDVWGTQMCVPTWSPGHLSENPCGLNSQIYDFEQRRSRQTE